MNDQNYDFKIKCPKCGFKEADEEHFWNTVVPCGDCGTHTAIECPQCKEKFDNVWQGWVCSVCGLIINSYDKCPCHPDAERLDWGGYPLNRGS